MPRNGLKAAFVVAYALHVVAIVLMAGVPPVSRDALTHHLAVPQLWLERGILAEIPEILFSYYPQLLDLLYLAPLAVGHDIAAKYIHFSFALLTAILIFVFVRRRIGSAWGALAGLMFLSIPIVIKLSVTVYVDLGLVFFTTGALFSAVLWLEDTHKTKWLILAAICSGLALSTKYNALVSFMALGFLIPFFYLSTRQEKQTEQLNTIKFGVLFVAISLLVFSPWMIRNMALTGSPLYPLQAGFLEGQAAGQVAPDERDKGDDRNNAHIKRFIAKEMQQAAKPLGPLLLRKFVYEESLPYTLLIPLRVFYEGQDDNPKFFDGRLNLSLLLLPLALLFLSGRTGFRHPELRFFGYFSALVVLLTFLTSDMRARYIAVVIPPLVVLSVYCLYTLSTWLSGRARSSVTARFVTSIALVVFFLPNLNYGVDLFRRIDPLPYWSGKISRDEYIAERIPMYELIVQANAIVPDDGKVLGLFLGNRRYVFTVDAVLMNSIFTSVAEDSESEAAIAQELKRLGYTHLVVNNVLFGQWLDGAQEVTKARVKDFLGHRIRELASQNGYGLYEIK